MMNIWLINHYYVPPTEWGGTRHHALAKSWVDNGDDVTVIAANFSHYTHEYLTHKPKETVVEIRDGLRIIWLPVPPYKKNSIKRLWNMNLFAWRLLGAQKLKSLPKPDVVIGSSPHLFAAMGGKWIARRYKIPFVLEIRDLWPETLIQLGKISKWHPAVLFFGLMERRLYRRSDAIVSLLPKAGEYMTKKGAAPHKIHWIPNFVDFSQIPEAYALPENETFTFVYAGSHGVANGLSFLIEAAAQLAKMNLTQKWQIQLIGDGAEKQNLIQQAKSLGLQQVIFAPPVPKIAIYDTLLKADALVFCLMDSPLYRYGISLNKMFDYMGVGRPIIFAANVSYNPIKEAEAGVIVPPDDPLIFAKGIATLMGLSKTEREAMATRGRDHAKQHYALSQLSLKYRHLLNSLTAKEALVNDTPV